MGRAKHLDSYKEEWADIAQELAFGKGEVTFKPYLEKSDAQALRLRFYNFRNALERHDLDNPWLRPILGKVATIKRVAAGWELHIGEDRFRDAIREALGTRAEVSLSPPEPETPPGPSTEDVLSEMYGPRVTPTDNAGTRQEPESGSESAKKPE